MLKAGHILVTSQVIPLCTNHRKWILLGSIAPDFMFHTFIKGHTIDATGEKIFQLMEKLEQTGKRNAKSYFLLGVVLHYVEDYFTFPHNNNFNDSGNHLFAHPLYEEEQLTFLKKHIPEQTRQEKTQDVVTWIRDTHTEYMKEEAGIENDAKYSYLAAECVMDYFAYEFRINQLVADTSNDFTESLQYFNQDAIVQRTPLR